MHPIRSRVKRWLSHVKLAWAHRRMPLETRPTTIQVVAKELKQLKRKFGRNKEQLSWNEQALFLRRFCSSSTQSLIHAYNPLVGVQNSIERMIEFAENPSERLQELEKAAFQGTADLYAAQLKLNKLGFNLTMLSAGSEDEAAVRHRLQGHVGLVAATVNQLQDGFRRYRLHSLNLGGLHAPIISARFRLPDRDFQRWSRDFFVSTFTSPLCAHLLNHFSFSPDPVSFDARLRAYFSREPTREELVDLSHQLNKAKKHSLEGGRRLSQLTRAGLDSSKILADTAMDIRDVLGWSSVSTNRSLESIHELLLRRIPKS